MPGSSAPVDGEALVDPPAAGRGDEHCFVRVLYRQATAEGLETIRGQCPLASITPLQRYETLCW